MATQAYLIDQLTDHEIDVIRVGNNAAADASTELFAVYKRIRQMLIDTPSTRWYKLSSDIEALLINEMRGPVAEIKGDLTEFKPIEATYTESLLVAGTTIDNISRTPESLIATYTNSKLDHFVEGKKVTHPTVNNLLAKLGKKNARAVRNIVRDAATTGQTAQQITGQIRLLAVNKNRRDIQAATLTAFKQISAQTQMAVYANNLDIMDKYRLSATLDSRTTIICMGYDGTEWVFGKGPIPPFHYRCRTQPVPVIKEQYRIPIQGRERATATGPVSASLTYDGWLRRMGAERQNDILGIERAKLFRRGLSVGKFTDNGVKLTLAQLKNRLPAKYYE